MDFSTPKSKHGSAIALAPARYRSFPKVLIRFPPPRKKKRGFVRKRMKGRLLVTGASHSYPTSCSCISSISFIDCMQHKKYSREGDNTARYEGVRNSYIVASASSCGVYIRTCLFHYCLPDALVQVQKLFF